MTSYSQLAANAHAAGGETQTEATAKISDTRVHQLARSRSGRAFLASIERDLMAEARVAFTDREYIPIRAQIVRVRDALYGR